MWPEWANMNKVIIKRDDLVKLCSLVYFGTENGHVISEIFQILTTCCWECLNDPNWAKISSIFNNISASDIAYVTSFEETKKK